MLWGERRVARFDSKLERASNTLTILGFWLEDEALGKWRGIYAEAGTGLRPVRSFSRGSQGEGKCFNVPAVKNTPVMNF
jgi:uncharacterized protein